MQFAGLERQVTGVDRRNQRDRSTWAISNAMADAGLGPDDIDGMLSYSGNDSTFCTLGRRRFRNQT